MNAALVLQDAALTYSMSVAQRVAHRCVLRVRPPLFVLVGICYCGHAVVSFRFGFPISSSTSGASTGHSECAKLELLVVR